jgi:photosystem II stability/assembly factor-like uncharacterized protein
MATSLACSADGMTVAGIDPNGILLWMSLDGGLTWTVRSPERQWKAVASSADGTRWIAAADNGLAGPLYLSTDSGTTWQEVPPGPFDRWAAVASSADGSRLVAAARQGDFVGQVGSVWMSMDAGATWKRATGARVGSPTALASSADGTSLFEAESDVGDAGPGRILANVPGPLVVHGSSLVDLTYLGDDTFFATNVEGSADAP